VILPPSARHLLLEARRATLATIDPDGAPRLVPVCYAIQEDRSDGLVAWIAIDAKPKRSEDPLALARVRDIQRDVRVTLLVDRWSEDWGQLAWVRFHGRATIVEPPLPEAVVAALLDRYPQYRTHGLSHRTALRVQVERVATWSASEAG
jgi:PPOX class probable F420-dependent enzyme